MKLNKFLKGLFGVLVCISIANCAFGGITNDAKLQYNKGVDYYNAGQYEQAVTSFKQAIVYDPNYIDAYYNLGSILEYLGNNEDALTAFKQIILRKPDDYESVYKAAEISKKLGQYDKAQMYLTLIPKETLMGQKAQELEKAISNDLSAAQEYGSEIFKPEKVHQNDAKINIIDQPLEDLLPPPASEVSEKAAGNYIYNDISSPTGLVTDFEGNLYVAGFSDNTIYKIGADNNKIVYIKSNKIDGPIGLVMDRDGNLYIANYNKNNVLKVDKGGVISEFISDIKNPYCMYISDNMLYVSSQGSNYVARYRLF